MSGANRISLFDTGIVIEYAGMLWKSCRNRRGGVEKLARKPPYDLANIVLNAFGGVFETKNPICRAQGAPGVICRSSDI